MCTGTSYILHAYMSSMIKMFAKQMAVMNIHRCSLSLLRSSTGRARVRCSLMVSRFKLVALSSQVLHRDTTVELSDLHDPARFGTRASICVPPATVHLHIYVHFNAAARRKFLRNTFGGTSSSYNTLTNVIFNHAIYVIHM